MLRFKYSVICLLREFKFFVHLINPLYLHYSYPLNTKIMLLSISHTALEKKTYYGIVTPLNVTKYIFFLNRDTVDL